MSVSVVLVGGKLDGTRIELDRLPNKLHLPVYCDAMGSHTHKREQAWVPVTIDTETYFIHWIHNRHPLYRHSSIEPEEVIANLLLWYRVE